MPGRLRSRDASNSSLRVTRCGAPCQVDDECVRRRCLYGEGAFGVTSEQKTLDPDPEPDPRNSRSSELFNQAVVTTSPPTAFCAASRASAANSNVVRV